MPPKAKFTREEIIDAAFQLAREKGLEAVVAREVGKRLGTSSSPIFTAFRNMEELHTEVKKAAMKKFETYVQDALNYSPVFKYVGLRMIRFAIEEPKLFQILYMQQHQENQTYEDLMDELGPTMLACLDYLKKEYELSDQEAYQLFRQVWLQTFAVCILLAGKVCNFEQDEISEILSINFQGTLMLIKSGKYVDIQISPSDLAR